MLRSTQPPTLRTGMSSCLQMRRPSVAEWGGGMSSCCTMGPSSLLAQCMATYGTAVSLADANQLPLPRL